MKEEVTDNKNELLASLGFTPQYLKLLADYDKGILGDVGQTESYDLEIITTDIFSPEREIVKPTQSDSVNFSVFQTAE